MGLNGGNKAGDGTGGRAERRCRLGEEAAEQPASGDTRVTQTAWSRETKIRGARASIGTMAQPASQSVGQVASQSLVSRAISQSVFLSCSAFSSKFLGARTTPPPLSSFPSSMSCLVALVLCRPDGSFSVSADVSRKTTNFYRPPPPPLPCRSLLRPSFRLSVAKGWSLTAVLSTGCFRACFGCYSSLRP